MEIERRPQPEKTDLEMLLRVKGPEFLQKHAWNMILGLLLIASITYFFVQRHRAEQSKVQETNQNTAIAYNYAVQLRDLVARPDLSDDAARQRQELATLVFTAADSVLNSESDATQKSAAQLSKAEALWALATAPAKALATTQPMSGFVPRSSADYMADAKAAYYEILQKYPEQKEAAANALLSLAAIEESSAKFNEARGWYDKVIGDPSLRPIYHDIAKSRIDRLSDLEKPFTLATPTTLPTIPLEAPPATLPATQPTP
jgi:hypothetical protein